MIGLILLSLGVAFLLFAVTSPFVLLDFENFQRAVLDEQGNMVSGVADFPFTRQYRGTTPYLYFIDQQIRWGMGWALGLLDAAGCELPTQLAHESSPQAGTRLLVLSDASTTVEFVSLDAEPVPSLLRGFSAPVVLELEQPDAHWLTLLAHDTDPFNRWEAGQRLALQRALSAIRAEGPVSKQPLDAAARVEIQRILDEERAGKNRMRLVSWLDKIQGIV